MPPPLHRRVGYRRTRAGRQIDGPRAAALECLIYSVPRLSGFQFFW
jgi:hypothetical protein